MAMDFESSVPGEIHVSQVFLGSGRVIASRLIAAVGIGIAFGFFVGWPLVGGWLLAYAAVLGVQRRLYGPSRKMTPLTIKLAAPTVFLASVAYGWITLAIPFRDADAWGAVCAAWMLAGSMAYSGLAYVGSRRLFFSALAPFTAFALILAVEARGIGAHRSDLIALIVSALAVTAIAIALWRGNRDVRAAEAAARAESERRRIEAEDAVAAKSAFMAVVSHELRTPISAILAASADLQKHLAGADAGTARLIAESGAMMRTLLNDLLDKAKMDAGKMAVELAAFDIRTLVADQLQFWRAEAERKGVDLRLSGVEDLPQWLMGDSIRIRQILNNLLSNALKFTDKGEVALEIAAAAADGNWLLGFTVRDSGPGLSEEALANLFQPFEQAEAARNQGGTGLGLAISRDLARLMGGELSAQSRPGYGAAFTLALTLAQAATPEAVAAPAEADLPPLKVLVVDDHEINRRAMSLILSPLGVELSEAASGFEALALLETDRFDVILMDCLMPGMDGRQTTRELRADRGPNRSTPVIAVTGSTDEAEIEACRAAGMNGHVAKPIDPTQLIGAIMRAMEEAEALAA
jgi:signal transduction histidine kinase/ActR/RegA family two-component response regulator